MQTQSEGQQPKLTSCAKEFHSPQRKVQETEVSCRGSLRGVPSDLKHFEGGGEQRRLLHLSPQAVLTQSWAYPEQCSRGTLGKQTHASLRIGAGQHIRTQFSL